MSFDGLGLHLGNLSRLSGAQTWSVSPENFSGDKSGGRYLPLQDDIASVAYWYQALPTAPFPPFPEKDSLEII